MGFFGIPWTNVAKFALTTTATVAGGAVGSLIPIPGVGTALGASAGAFLSETLWDGFATGDWGEAASNGAESGALALLGGGAGGAARGAFATLGGRNLARRMLDGAIHPAVRNPAANVGAAWTARGASLNAARGWLAGAGVGAGLSSAGHSGGPGSAPGQGQSYPATLPTKPLNASTTFSTS
ncbi:hypothetical protein IFM12275_48180 [Nocardia sputorum]|uniref:Uncharacterized protein n=1 Tax=Nocardia sputorum TaxID=2984338 RepID=A0ABM8D3F4_9NOCA|nr:hypothetical protein IFM12275_48180 [Nocardia sputorum]BDU01907.1 hypothetical protein IFM12276_49350 [Nocardia sputorum]